MPSPAPGWAGRCNLGSDSSFNRLFTLSRRKLIAALGGIPVMRVMITSFHTLRPDDRLARAVDQGAHQQPDVTRLEVRVRHPVEARVALRVGDRLRRHGDPVAAPDRVALSDSRFATFYTQMYLAGAPEKLPEPITVSSPAFTQGAAIP